MRPTFVSRTRLSAGLCWSATALALASLVVVTPASAQEGSENQAEPPSGQVPVEGTPNPTGDQSTTTVLAEETSPQNPDQPSTEPTPTDPTQPAETASPESSTTSTTTPGPTTTTDEASGEKSRGGYSSQPPFVPDSVDPAKVAQATSKVAEAKQALADAVRLETERENNVDGVNKKVDALGQESADIVNQTARLQREIRTMAVSSFKNPSVRAPKLDVEYKDSHEAMTSRKFVAYIAERDQAAIKEYGKLQAELSVEEAEIVAETAQATDEHNQAKILVQERTRAVEQAELELQTYESAAEDFIPNAVFPVAQPYSFPLINSYGFDRARGTADSHWHEGIDIFGPMGTDLVAAESGVITKVGSGRLGGLTLWITGVSGTKWYYAHLHGFAPGVKKGLEVEAGTVVGYLGDSGNAKGTPPHLHLEIHPPGKRVVNPYPQLNVLAERDQARSKEQLDGSAKDDATKLNISSGS